jgi:hypothetical protein
MTRIYDNPSLAKRSNISMVILVVVIVYGVWDLWHAFRTAGGALTIDLAFGALFIGGGIYGIWRTMTDARDVVTALDEGDGRAVVTLWRPLQSKRIDVPLAALTRWRHYVKIGQRKARSHVILVDCPEHPHPLQIEMPRGIVPSEGLRRLAPEAVEDFERDTGVNSAAS